MDVITIVLIIVTCVILSLGVVVISNSREKLNRLYFLNILTIVGWALTIMFYRLSNDNSILIWTRLLYVAASLIASNFLYFTYVFPKYIVVPVKIKTLIFLPNILLIILCLFGNQIITGAKININGENIITWGRLYILYVIYILLYFNFAFFRLFKKRLASKERIERIQITFVLLGYVSSGFIAFTTNLILPSFGYFTLNWLGQVSTVLMAISATYAIVKHKLFNAKVIVTELLTFTIWIIILVRLLISQSRSDLLANSTTLFLTVIVGILLIRSVIKEVETRERVEKLAIDLKKANDRLTELDRQKSEFVSFATHQLRAPLTAMKGYASLLLEGEMGTLSVQQKEGIARIFESTKTLVNIVDDYLNVSRIELGTMKYAFETIDLKQLVDDVIGELKPNIEKTKLDFSFNAEPLPNGEGTDYRITADRDKLKQVVANLIDNSIKYTPNGSVKVSLSYDEHKHKFIFKLRDTGIGIAPEVLPHLFQKFSRAKNANKVNIKGTGLGLFVAKEIVEAHHGLIYVESEGEGKGSAFIVEFEPFVKA
jgi:signal transduction histidine kinase